MPTFWGESAQNLYTLHNLVDLEKQFDIPNFQQHFDSSYIGRFTMLIILHVVNRLKIRCDDVRCNDNCNFTVIIGRRSNLLVACPIHIVFASIQIVRYSFCAHMSESDYRVVFFKSTLNVRMFRFAVVVLSTEIPMRFRNKHQFRSNKKKR